MFSPKPTGADADAAQPPAPDKTAFRSGLIGRFSGTLPGTPLSSRDFESLQHAGIDRTVAEHALRRRVDSFTGAQMVGRQQKGDYAGIIIPYIWPGEQHIREYRLRRDHPEIESGKAKNKYLSRLGRANMLYFVPGTRAEWLCDPTLPIVLTEGEKKCIALCELSWAAMPDGAGGPAWLTIGVPGVWNWHGKVGNTGAQDGSRLREEGPNSRSLSSGVDERGHNNIRFERSLEPECSDCTLLFGEGGARRRSTSAICRHSSGQWRQWRRRLNWPLGQRARH